MTRHLTACLLVATVLVSAQSKQTFTGTITDSECGTAGHSIMKMGSTDAECVVACISSHGAAYVLNEGRKTYALSDQPAAAKFAGRRVKIVGTLSADTKTIHVDSISAPR
jgi:Protein of unknown function (DUF5818)